MPELDSIYDDLKNAPKRTDVPTNDPDKGWFVRAVESLGSLGENVKKSWNNAQERTRMRRMGGDEEVAPPSNIANASSKPVGVTNFGEFMSEAGGVVKEKATQAKDNFVELQKARANLAAVGGMVASDTLEFMGYEPPEDNAEQTGARWDYERASEKMEQETLLPLAEIALPIAAAYGLPTATAIGMTAMLAGSAAVNVGEGFAEGYEEDGIVGGIQGGAGGLKDTALGLIPAREQVMERIESGEFEENPGRAFMESVFDAFPDVAMLFGMGRGLKGSNARELIRKRLGAIGDVIDREAMKLRIETPGSKKRRAEITERRKAWENEMKANAEKVQEKMSQEKSDFTAAAKVQEGKEYSISPADTDRVAKEKNATKRVIEDALDSPAETVDNGDGTESKRIIFTDRDGQLHNEWVRMDKVEPDIKIADSDVTRVAADTEPLPIHIRRSALKELGMKAEDLYDTVQNPVAVFSMNGEHYLLIEKRGKKIPLLMDNKSTKYLLDTTKLDVEKSLPKSVIEYYNDEKIGKLADYFPDQTKRVSTQENLGLERYALKGDYKPSDARVKPDFVSTKQLMAAFDRLVPTKYRYGQMAAESRRLGGIVAGEYNPRAKDVKLARIGSFDTVAHEFGHWISDTALSRLDENGKKVFNLNDYADELVRGFMRKYKNNPPDGYKPSQYVEEGFAEFMNRFMNEGGEAVREDYPKFYKDFFTEMGKPENRQLLRDVNELETLVRKYNNMNEWQRGLAGITASDDTPVRRKDIVGTKEWFGKQWARMRTNFLDDKYSLKQYLMDMKDLTGQEVEFADNVYYNARFLESHVSGQLSLLLNHAGDEAMIIDEINKFYDGAMKHDVTFGGILNRIDNVPVPKEVLDLRSAKDNRQLFSVYWIAERAEYLRNNRKGFELYEAAGFTPDVCRKIIKEAPQEFKAILNDLQNYYDNLQSLRQWGGLISAKDKKNLQALNEIYAPMERDFSEGSPTTQTKPKRPGGYVNISDQDRLLTKEGSSRNILDPLEQTAKYTREVLDKVNRNKVALDFVRFKDVQGIGRILEYRPEYHGESDAKNCVFQVYENGVKKSYWTLPDYYEALTSYSAQTFPIWLKFAMIPATLLRMGATGTPAFAAMNMARDTVNAAVFGRNGNFVPFADSLRGAFILKSGSEANRRLTYQFIASGVPMSTLTSVERSQMSFRQTPKYKAFQANPYTRWGTKIADGLLGLVEKGQELNETVENSTRMAEFEAALRRGKSIQEAAIDAKEITLDFAKAGRIGRQVNRVIPFFNAALQGMEKLPVEASSRPAVVGAKIATWILLPKFFEWAAYHDEDWYKDTPDWLKDNYFTINLGGDKMMRVPLPQELTWIASMFNRGLRSAFDGDDFGVKAWLANALNILTPDMNLAFIRPLYEWQSGYNFFTGRQTVPRALQGLPDKEQYDIYTSGVAKEVGQILNVSPKKVDAAIKSSFGSGGEFATGMIDTVAEAIKGEQSQRPQKYWTELPIIGRFTAQKGKSSKNLQDFYDIYEETMQEVNAYGKQAKNYRYWEDMKRTIKQVRDVNRQINDIKKNSKLTPLVKRQRMDKLQEKLVKITTAANKRYRK